jgi:hypothetical protein
VQGGNATVSSNGFGGAATLAGGDSTSSAGAGGATTVRGGNGSGGASGGNLLLNSGGGGSASGTIGIASPNQVAGNAGSGGITIQTGTATNLGAPGNIALIAGNQVWPSGTAWNQNGGSISLTTGFGGWQNSNGGDLNLTLGAQAGTGRPGQMKVTGGLSFVVPTTLAISTATFTPNGTSNNYNITLVHASCPCTLANPSVTPVAGQTGKIVVTQSATGSDTIGTYGSFYKFSGGTAPTLTAAANSVDLLSYYVIDATHIAVSTQADVR